MLALSRQVTVGVDGAPLSFRLFGQGPTRIVLLHGLGGDSSDWLSPRMAEVLDTVHATYAAIDLRGHGIDVRHSAPHHLDLNLLCADISEMVTTIGWEEYGVVGYSFGAVVSLLHAADPRVSWSVSGGVNERTTDAEHASILAAALLDPTTATDDIADTVAFTQARRRNPATLAQLCRTLPDALNGVLLDPARHAVIIGEDDDPESARRVARAVGDLPLTIAAGDHVTLFLSGDFLRQAFDIASRAGWINTPVTRGGSGARVLVLSGLPGSGKTSIARALASLTNAARISSDELRAALPHRTYSDSESALIYKRAVDLVADAASHNPVVVFDATNLRTRPDLPDAAEIVASSVHLDGGTAITVALDAEHEVLIERLTVRGAIQRFADDFSEATPTVLQSFTRVVPPISAAHIDTSLFKPDMTACMLAPLLDGRQPALTAAQHISDYHLMQNTALEIEAHGPIALLDSPWTLRLLEQIDCDAASGVLGRWGKSRLVDELTQERILRPDVGAVLAHRSGTSIQWPVMHAGILHTYGYLLSSAWTAYGWKRDRWTSGATAAALGLDPRGLSVDPPEGTLLSNLTAVLDSLLGRCANPILDPAEFRISQITETPDGDAGVTVLRTYFVAAKSRRTGNPERVLLVYTAQAGRAADELLVTAFPVTAEYRDSLIAGCGKDQPISAKFNAATPIAENATGQRTYMSR